MTQFWQDSNPDSYADMFFKEMADVAGILEKTTHLLVSRQEDCDEAPKNDEYAVIATNECRASAAWDLYRAICRSEVVLAENKERLLAWIDSEGMNRRAAPDPL